MTNAKSNRGRSNRKRLKQKIQRLNGAHEPAAPRNLVVKFARYKLGIEKPEAFVDQLERDGTIYSPRPGFLRVTDQ